MKNKTSIEDIQKKLNEHYKLEETFNGKLAERAVYDYFKKVGIDIPDKFWIDEISNGYTFSGLFDDQKRNLAKDLNFFLNNTEGKRSFNETECLLLKNAEGDGYTDLIKAFGEGKLMHVGSSGNLVSGTHVFNDLYILDSKIVNREKFIAQITQNLCSDNGLNYDEYKNISNLLKSPVMTKEIADDLLDNLSNIDNQKIYNKNYKKIYDEISTKAVDYWEKQFQDVIEKIDEQRQVCEKIGYDASIDNDGLLAEINDQLSASDQKKFAEYVNHIMQDAVPENTKDKEFAALSLIIEKQNERLEKELKEITLKNDLTTKYIQCNLDTGERAESIRTLLEADKKNPLCGVIMDRNKALKRAAIAVWSLNNIAMNVKNCQKIEKNVMLKVNNFNKKMYLEQCNTMQRLMLGMNKKMGKLEYKYNNGNIITQALTKHRLERYKNSIENLQKQYDLTKNKVVILDRKVEKIQNDLNKINTRKNSIHYLNDKQFDSLKKEEKEILREFSIAAKKSFTLEEANVILNTYVASNGKFTPETILGVGIKGNQIMDIAIEANADINGVTPKISIMQKAIDYLKINNVYTDVSENMIKIFGNDKFALSLPYEEQTFLLDKYQEGVSVDILREEGVALYNKKDYTIDDARENIANKHMENASYNIPLNEIELTTSEKERLISLNSTTALDNLGELAKNMNNTIRLDFDDKNHRYNYNLVAAKNGRQFFLNVTDKVTGEEVSYRATNKIAEQISKSTHFAQQICLKVAEGEQIVKAEKRKQQKIEKKKEKEKEMEL